MTYKPKPPRIGNLTSYLSKIAQEYKRMLHSHKDLFYFSQDGIFMLTLVVPRSLNEDGSVCISQRDVDYIADKMQQLIKGRAMDQGRAKDLKQSLNSGTTKIYPYDQLMDGDSEADDFPDQLRQAREGKLVCISLG